jgi:hypothetical protein
MCLDRSMTTAWPTVWPARLVPAPLGRTGTPNWAATLIVAETSSGSRGKTTPMGSIAYMLASLANRLRVIVSKRTSPPTARASACARSRDLGGEVAGLGVRGDRGGPGDGAWLAGLLTGRSERRGQRARAVRIRAVGGGRLGARGVGRGGQDACFGEAGVQGDQGGGEGGDVQVA